MLTEQLISIPSTELETLQNDSSQKPSQPKRKVSWFISLIHYFAFGVDAYLLLMIAEQSAANRDQNVANAVPNLGDLAEIKPFPIFVRSEWINVIN